MRARTRTVPQARWSSRPSPRWAPGCWPAVPTTATTGSDSSAAAAARARPRSRIGLFGTFGFKEAGLYDEYEKLAPGHRHQADRHRAQRELLPGSSLNHLTTSSGLARHPGDRGRQHRRDRRRPRPTSSSTSARTVDRVALAGLEVDAGHHQGRQDDRARHRHRPDGDLLPQGPVRGGRSAHRPRGGRQAVGGRLEQVRRRRQAVQDEGAKGTTFVDSAGGLLQRDRSAVRPSGTTTRTARSSTRPTRP